MSKAARTTEDIINRVENEFGFLRSHQVDQRLGGTPDNAEGAASRGRHDGNLLAIGKPSQQLFPAFQFHRDGSPRAVVRALREMCDVHGWTESDLVLWLVTSASRLGGARPVDLMLAEEAAADERLLWSAELEVATEW